MNNILLVMIGKETADTHRCSLSELILLASQNKEQRSKSCLGYSHILYIVYMKNKNILNPVTLFNSQGNEGILK